MPAAGWAKSLPTTEGLSTHTLRRTCHLCIHFLRRCASYITRIKHSYSWHGHYGTLVTLTIQAKSYKSTVQCSRRSTGTQGGDANQHSPWKQPCHQANGACVSHSTAVCACKWCSDIAHLVIVQYMYAYMYAYTCMHSREFSEIECVSSYFHFVSWHATFYAKSWSAVKSECWKVRAPRYCISTISIKKSDAVNITYQ